MSIARNGSLGRAPVGSARPSSALDPKCVAQRFDYEIVFKLSLASRGLPAITGLSMCINLVELDLSDNCISRMEGLDGLESLRRLNLSQNRVQRVEGVAGLKKLEVLLLQGNQIPNLDALGLPLLAALPAFKALVLQCTDRSLQNPVCRAAGYKAAVLQHLPRLSNLDGERCPLVINYAELAAEMEAYLKNPPPPKVLELPDVTPWLQGASLDVGGPPGLDPDTEAKTGSLVKGLDECRMLCHVLLDEVGKLRQQLTSQPSRAAAG